MLAHFYHVYADGAWQDAVAEHLAALEVSGLGAALDCKAAGVVGQPENCQAAISALGGGWQVAATADTGFEEVTLAALHAYAAHNGKVLYAHTKASWDTSRANILWRRRMTYYCAGKWREAVAALDDHDCAGPHFVLPEQWAARGVTCPMFGGNFWWANLAFLRRLPMPVLRDGDRHAAERWIGQTVTPDAWDMCPVWPTDGLEAMEAQVDAWRLGRETTLT